VLAGPGAVDSARSRLANPAAKSPAPVASRSANSGLGSRNAAIVRQIGQTPHSAAPVAKPPRPGVPLADPAALVAGPAALVADSAALVADSAPVGLDIDGPEVAELDLDDRDLADGASPM
jgi:hypothetical protein